MQHNLLLEELKKATSPEQKAALVADAIINDLPENVAKAAIRCGFLPWFSDEIIQGMMEGSNDKTKANLIIELPFVEKLSTGYCFHSTTRRGFLNYYLSENPVEIQRACDLLEKNILTSPAASDLTLSTLLYGYVITKQGIKAEELLIKLVQKRETFDLHIFSDVEEAESICNAEKIGLTPTYWFYKSQLHLVEAEFEKIINDCNNALALDENYSQAYAVRGYAYARLENFEEATHDVDYAVRLGADDYTYRIRAAVNLLQKNYKAAIFDFTRAIRNNPTSIFGYLGRSQTYAALMQSQKAERDLSTALGLSTDKYFTMLIYMEFANALIASKQWEDALEYLDKSIDIKPLSGLYRRRGDALFNLSRVDEASIAYEMSIALDDTNPFAYIGRGRIFLNDRMYLDAISMFKKALLLPRKKSILSPSVFDVDEAYLRLWETYILSNDEEKAKEQRDIVLKISKNRKQLGEVMFFCRKYKLYNSLLDASLMLIDLQQDDSSFGYTSAGYSLNSLGRYEEALLYLEKDKSSRENDALFHINSGLSFWGMGNDLKARGAFEKANLIMHDKSSTMDFKSRSKKTSSFDTLRPWVNLVLGNSNKALRTIKNPIWKKNINLDSLYDIRDWNYILKQISKDLPIGFDEFSESINDLLIEFGDREIYKLT